MHIRAVPHLSPPGRGRRVFAAGEGRGRVLISSVSDRGQSCPSPQPSPRKSGAREDNAARKARHFFTVFAGAFAGACGFFCAGLALSTAALMSSISLETRAALLPRSLSK